MKTKLALWMNSAVFAFAAVWFFVAPVVGIMRDLADPALASGGIPRCVFAWHRHLSGEFGAWARGTVSAGGGKELSLSNIKDTEWPAHSAMFYLLATEELQQAWEKDHSLAPVAPAVYARGAIDAAAALLMDPGNASWVRRWWGDDKYLKTQDVFFRMMVMNGLTAHLALTGDKRYADFLRGQADSLATELDASPWGLLDDYPGQCYPVDIVPAIAAIQRVDRLLGTDHSRMIAGASRLLTGNVIDPATGLPGYEVDAQSGRPNEPARGIGMSMTLVWTPQLWPDVSARLYATYVKQFWRQDAMLAGFREFRAGSGAPDWQDEVDAGPVIAGYGTSASAFGMAAANANGDRVRARLLEMEAIAGAWPLPDGTLAGARVLSTPEAPYTGVTALLFALTRTPAPAVALNIASGTVTPADPATIYPQAADRTPGFVHLFVGGGLLIGLLMLFAVARRLVKPWREISGVGFAVWAALMAAGAAMWFFNPWWTALAWLVAQFWPRPLKREKKAAALAPAAPSAA